VLFEGTGIGQDASGAHARDRCGTRGLAHVRAADGVGS
jgi:hypothetical protein